VRTPAARAETDALVEAIGQVYDQRGGWTLCREVQAEDADGSGGVRYADLVAVRRNAARLDLVAFELKRTMADADRETPAKSAAIRAYASEFYLVVPSPWRNVLRSLSDLPAGVGLFSCGGAGDPMLVPATRRAVDPPTPALVHALLRAAASRCASSPELPAPPWRALQGYGERPFVFLSCGHMVVNLDKRTVPLVGCPSCAAHLPPDVEATEHAIDTIPAEHLDRLAVALERRRAETFAARGAA
jgi:hypothetical protein